MPQKLALLYLFVTQLILYLSQSIFLGNVAEYIFLEDPTEEQTRNGYLYGLGLALASLSLPVLHAHGFLMGYRLAMDVRIVATTSIFQKVCCRISSDLYSALSHYWNGCMNGLYTTHYTFVVARQHLATYNNTFRSIDYEYYPKVVNSTSLFFNIAPDSS